MSAFINYDRNYYRCNKGKKMLSVTELQIPALYHLAPTKSMTLACSYMQNLQPQFIVSWDTDVGVIGVVVY